MERGKPNVHSTAFPVIKYDRSKRSDFSNVHGLQTIQIKT